MARKLLLDVKDVTAGGIAPAVDFSAVPLWADGENVVFQDGAIKPVPSQVAISTKLSQEPGRGMIEVLLKISGAWEKHLFWCVAPSGATGSGKIFRMKEAAGIPTEVTGGVTVSGWNRNQSQTAPATFGTFAKWGDNKVLFSDGINGIYISTNGGNFGTLTAGQPAFANVLISYLQFMVAVGTDLGQNVVQWSDEDDVESANAWTPASTNMAGDLVVHDANGPLLCALPLGSGIGIYSSNELFLLNYVGPPVVMGLQPLLTGVGALGKYSVCEMNRVHYGISGKGVFRTDGTSVQYFDDPMVRDYLKNAESAGAINSEQGNKIVAWANPQQKMVWFFYPRVAALENDYAVGFHVESGLWTKASYGRSCVTSGGVFTHPTLIGPSGDIFQEVLGGAAPTLGNFPMVLQGEATLALGYGYGGYGEGSFGGTLVVAG